MFSATYFNASPFTCSCFPGKRAGLVDCQGTLPGILLSLSELHIEAHLELRALLSRSGAEEEPSAEAEAVSVSELLPEPVSDPADGPRYMAASLMFSSCLFNRCSKNLNFSFLSGDY